MKNSKKGSGLLDALPDGKAEAVLILDAQGCFLDYLPAFDQEFLLQNKHLRGNPLTDSLPTHVGPLFLKALQGVREHRKPQHLEFSTKGEPEKHYEARLLPLNDDKNIIVLRDITERVQNEQDLIREKSRLRNYLDSAGSMFIVLKPDYSIALVNRKACEVLGYPMKDLLNQNWLPYIKGKKEQKRLKILFDQTFRVKKELSDYFESPVTSKSGTTHLIRWQNALLKDDSGNPTGLICSGVDISEQKTAENQFLRSEERNRAILEAIPDVILLHDRHGRVLRVKESARSPHCFQKERIEGKCVADIFPGKTGREMLLKIQESCQSGQTKILETDLDTDQGKLSYEIRYVCMEDQQVLAVARNITDTRTTQQGLNLRNRALEAAGNGIIIVDAILPDLPIIYSNKAFTEITQYSAEESIGKNCRFLQGPQTDPEKVRQIREALEHGTQCRVELRNYRKDGSLFWNELTITPIRDHAGALTHFIGVQNDISTRVLEGERKDHIRRILEAITHDKPLEKTAGMIASFLRAYFPHTGIQIALWQPGGEVLETLSEIGLPPVLSHKLRKVGLKKDTGCPCAMAVRTKKASVLEDLEKNEASGKFIKTIKAVNIKSCWSFPVLSSENKVLGTCTFYGPASAKPEKEKQEMVQDATQLAGLAIERYFTRIHLEESNSKLEQYAKNLEKDVAQRTEEVESTLQKLTESNLSLQSQIKTTQKAEERALANQELFAAIARNFPRGVIMVFNALGHYVHLEGEELDRMGLRDWLFLEKPILKTPGFSPEKLKDLDNKVRQTLLGQHLSFEVHIKENTYAVNSMPLYAGETPGWALLVLTNVTEQKKSEEDLLRALRIEQELNDLKSRFISMASHEFRTPLSAIHSSAILIGKQNTPGLEDKRLRYLRQIKNNVRNLVVILDDFLSLSKLEEGNIEAQPDTFDALDLIRSVLEELESNLKVGQHFTETFEMSSLQVYQDPKLLRQILVNLLSNAIKYAPEKTGIFIAIEKGETTFTISIQDKGIGIPEQEHDQLFNRFFRARNAINIPGTGLGLHLVKLYTELMGGTITFTSVLDRGSTFTLRLPLVFNPN
ncbi:MAG: PAS domain S-box protein [Robiginitalea sp.]|uniref:PAS domain S-box protein n=1 Tax=Robiginitalea sp. TaxID=1902411 RepID=UPI003C72DBFF